MKCQASTPDIALVNMQRHRMRRYTKHNRGAPVSWPRLKSKYVKLTMPDKAVKLPARHKTTDMTQS